MLDQLLVDFFVAARCGLVPESVLAPLRAECFTQGSLLRDSRLIDLLIERQLVPIEVARELTDTSDSYYSTLSRLGLDATRSSPLAAAADRSGEFDTLMEGHGDSSTGDLATPPASGAGSSGSGLLPGEIRYRKQQAFAEGGLGKVWLASDLELNRQVALKEIQPVHADDLACRARFLQEAEITGSLEHPGIVPVYGLGQHADGRPFYAMRFIEGQTLRGAIDELFHEIPRFPYRDGVWRVKFLRLLNRFLDVCNTLEYAHSKHVIHRDIKPSNIMLGAFGETLVVDWGLAKLLSAESDSVDALLPSGSGSGAELTVLGTAVGTPAYMSPEQATGGKTTPIDHRSDIFSLGATLFHLLVGSPPVGQSDARLEPGEIAAAAEVSPRERREDVPRALASICRKAMALRPEDRYASAKALAGDLENWLADQPVLAHRESLPEAGSRWLRTHPTLVATGVVAAILLTLASTVGLGLRNRYQLEILRQQQAQAQIQAAHRQQVSAAVDAAEAAALVEIRNSRFEAALEFLDSAASQLAAEPSLTDRIQAIELVRERTGKLLDFYKYMAQAEELAFLDSSRRSTIYFQKALQSLDVFERLDWWNALPAADLTDRQLHTLRSEAYRAMFLLTALRLKETLPADLNVQEMLTMISDESKLSNQAAAVLCDLLDAYRPSQGAVLGREFAQSRLSVLSRLLAGMALSRQAIEWQPKNSSDLYVMGTALAYMDAFSDEEQKKSFAAILGVSSAAQESARMLSLAGELQPDHFWTQLIRSFFESLRGEHESAARSYVHAISLRPTYWLPHAWKGYSTLQHALSLPEDDAQRRSLLQRASRELERAVDLDPTARAAHVHRGQILFALATDPREVVATYTAVLAAQEPFATIRDSLVEANNQWELNELRNNCIHYVNSDPNASQLWSCLAWAELLLGRGAEARSAAENCLKLAADDRVASYVLSSLESESGEFESAMSRLEGICAMHPDWFHAWLAKGVCAEQLGRNVAAAESFTQAVRCASLDWQRLEAQRGLARLAIQSTENPSSEAGEVVPKDIRLAIELGETDAFEDLWDLAIESDAGVVQAAITAHRDGLRPVVRVGKTSRAYRPALMNGSFELGLTSYWGGALDEVDRPAWQKFGTSLALATVSTQTAHSGQRALRITNLEAPESESAAENYSQLTQTFPVVPGEAYRISLWARSDRCEVGAVSVHLGNGVQALALPSGHYDWQQLSGTFIAESSTAKLRIVCTGIASVWIDTIEIALVETEGRSPAESPE